MAELSDGAAVAVLPLQIIRRSKTKVSCVNVSRHFIGIGRRVKKWYEISIEYKSFLLNRKAGNMKLSEGSGKT